MNPHRWLAPRTYSQKRLLWLGASARALALRGSGCRNLALAGHFVNKSRPDDHAVVPLQNHHQAAAGVVHFEVTADTVAACGC
jgi:hypothetical protein